MRLRVQHIDLTDGTSGTWYARAHIVTGAAEDRYDPGTILLSHDCRTSEEVIFEADRLISELKKIRVQASKIKWNSIRD